METEREISSSSGGDGGIVETPLSDKSGWRSGQLYVPKNDRRVGRGGEEGGNDDVCRLTRLGKRRGPLLETHLPAHACMDDYANI